MAQCQLAQRIFKTPLSLLAIPTKLEPESWKIAAPDQYDPISTEKKQGTVVP
jgi:hypothetical protein